jgi:RNA polymerase sigma-70 factor (ECF subfamily)
MLDRASTALAHSLREDLETCESRAGAETARTDRTQSPPSSDEQLLEAVAADPSALAALYGRYAKLVYRRALAILRCREEAQDLTHEVFLSVCEPTAYDRDRGSVGAFLTTMTRSRAIDRLRRRGRSARLLRTWHEAAPATPAPRTPFEHVSMRRSVERVRALLAELPGTQRQVLEMAYYDGLSQREIAADLGTPLGTVKSLSRRALQKLERALRSPESDLRRAAGRGHRSYASKPRATSWTSFAHS